MSENAPEADCLLPVRGSGGGGGHFASGCEINGGRELCSIPSPAPEIPVPSLSEYLSLIPVSIKIINLYRLFYVLRLLLSTSLRSKRF